MVLSVLILMLLSARAADSLAVVFWNLENFFDWKDGGYSDSDREFSSKGSRHWTYKRYMAKSAAVAKTIMWIGDQRGAMPELVCVAEIESRKILTDLAKNTPMRKFRYEAVHYESADNRGIDVGLLYRPSSLALLSSSPVRIHGFTTRDILLCSFRTRGGDTLHVLVNHHPSKYGGAASIPRRLAAVSRLRGVCDSLWEAGGRNIILTGDFNDTPENPAFRQLTDTLPGSSCPPFANLALPLAAAGEGTIRFNGKWDLIDMFFLSPPVLPDSRMTIVRAPFLLVRDNVHPGLKPLRTYSGPRYEGGVSDHLPILLEIRR